MLLSSVVRGRNWLPAAIPRWIIAITLLTILIGVGQWNSSLTTRQQLLGLRVQASGGEMIVSWVLPSGNGWNAQLRPGDVVVRADDVPVSSSSDPAAVARAQSIEVRSATGTRTISVAHTPTYPPWERDLLFLIAACFALVSIMVYVLATDTVASSVMLVNGVSGALLFTCLVGKTSGNPVDISLLLFASVAFSASLLLLFFAFPINWLRLRKWRLVAGVAVAPSLAVTGAFLVAVIAAPRSYTWLQYIAYVVHFANLVGAVALMAFALSHASPDQRSARRAMRIVWFGTAAGILPSLVLLVIPTIIGVGPITPAPVATLSIIMIPISLGIAISSRQFFGITRLLRRGLVALVVWLTLISGLSIAIRGIERWHTGQQSLSNETPFITAVVIAIVAVVLWPAQSWLRRRLERSLFRDVYDYQETLRQLSVEIVEIRGLEAIAEHVLRRLRDVMDLSWSRIELTTAAGKQDFVSTPHPCEPGQLPAEPSIAAAPELQVPLIIEHEPIGVLSLGPKRHDVAHSPEDIALVTTLAPMIATACHSALLLRRLEAQVVVLVEREQALAALSAQLMQVQEEERRRIALDLHDDPLQRAILLARKITQTSPSFDRSRLRQDAEEIINALRAICSGLRPPVLDDFGLVAGLESLVSEARARSELNISFDFEPSRASFGRLEPELETALYRVAQEALSNCIKHARATDVEVTLGRTANCVTLRIHDNGQGGALDPAFAADASHLGLLGMRERLQPWDGAVNVGSSVALGTSVLVTVPLKVAHVLST
jgi:signal transduction histidine kinase